MRFSGLRALAPIVGIFAFLAVGVGAAAAKPRIGTANDPVEGLPASRDFTRINASYDPTTGNFTARIRFSRPLTAGTMVQLWFRADRSRSCRGSARDIRFEARTQSGFSSFEVIRDRPAAASEGLRKFSSDKRELILAFGTPLLTKLDMRCVTAVTKPDGPRTSAVFDTLNAPLFLK